MGPRQPVSQAPGNLYASLYAECAAHHQDDDAVGDGSFELIGRIEQALLELEGLRPDDTVVDLGCGTGRLAVHLVPTLRGGHYVGVDITPAMLERAEQRLGRSVPAPSCRVSWVRQDGSRLGFAERSIDLMCAFSLFTHMEHEDTFRCLRDSRRAIRPRGRFILSCLPLELAAARDIFLRAAEDEVRVRWSRVRSITTSIEMITRIATLAGWCVRRWYPGDERCIPVAGSAELWALGQSVCVLEAPPG